MVLNFILSDTRVNMAKPLYYFIIGLNKAILDLLDQV